ncbi:MULTISPECIES: hypothetical protein [Oscillospiraceae]|uniref:hypothetical protein n=1 Tax=Oscillospiraceae TaxID=216572 RepID=UPI00135648E2|nr:MULTISPECIES: hypothetical protein [Oscillospiraceae]
MDRQNAWNIFLHTGRVEDYLNYVKLQNQKTTDFREDLIPDADDDRWDRDRYNQYR